MSTRERTGLARRAAAILGVATAIVAPVHSQAQEAGASSLLEEVIVTARRREESLQETPIAITALTGDTMLSMGIENSTDMAKFIPNMNAMQLGLGGGLGDNYTIRGIGTDRLFPDSESGVGIYIDDVFFPRVAANVVDMVELERVEVLRGPQGTLFGRNSMAGTIRYVTKKPTGEFGGNVRATTGEFNRLGIIGSVNFPISDNWAGLVSFGSDRRDGYITHELGPGTNGSKDNSTFRGKLRYESDRLTVDLGITETSVRSDGTPIVILSVSQPTDSLERQLGLARAIFDTRQPERARLQRHGPAGSRDDDQL
jgi:iron complex outermembrane receptor protein